jgi:hypothetical protein
LTSTWNISIFKQEMAEVDGCDDHHEDIHAGVVASHSFDGEAVSRSGGSHGQDCRHGADFLEAVVAKTGQAGVEVSMGTSSHHAYVEGPQVLMLCI